MLADGLAPASVAKVAQVLRLMLDLAVREGAVIANPVTRAQLPRQTRFPVAVLSPGQADRILASAAGTTDAALWGAMALAGLRLGEALGLADHDVDLDAGLLRVQRTLLSDRSFGPPKSERGLRDVPVTDRLERLLRTHRKLVVERRLVAATWIETDALFPTQRGTYPSIRKVQRRFRGVVRALGHLAKVHGMNFELRCSSKQLQGVTDVVEEHLVPAERRGQAAPGQAIRP
jgi:integrase